MDTLFAYDFDGRSQDTPIVQAANINAKPVSYAGAAGASSSKPLKSKANFRHLESENVCDGVALSIPLKVVQVVSTRFENTLYGYFMGKRIAFRVVEYYVRNNRAKYGLNSFARCLIEVKADEVLKIVLLWVSLCPKNATAIPNVDMTNDGFQKVVRLLLGSLRFEPKAAGNTIKNGAPNVSTYSKDGPNKDHTISKKQPSKTVDMPSSSKTSYIAIMEYSEDSDMMKKEIRLKGGIPPLVRLMQNKDAKEAIQATQEIESPAVGFAKTSNYKGELSTQEDHIRGYRSINRGRYQATRATRRVFGRNNYNFTLESAVDPERQLELSRERRANLISAEQVGHPIVVESYSALEAIVDGPQNITSQVRQLILLEDQYHGSTDEQDKAYRDLDRITCEETKNLWSFLEDFRQLAIKSGRLYFPSTRKKLFAKLPPSLSKRIEESFKAKYLSLNLGVLPAIKFTHTFVLEMCKDAALTKELRDLLSVLPYQLSNFDDSSVYNILEGEGGTHQNISVMVHDTPVEEVAFMTIKESDESDTEQEEEKDDQFNHHAFMFHPGPPTKIA
nr:zinc knuckle CX2CX4HX4C [Tanacetum cinerariifolium]